MGTVAILAQALFTASSMSVLLPRKESPCATAWLFRSRPGCARAHLHIGRIGHHGDGELIDLTPYASPELVNYLFNFGARCCGLRLFGGVTKGEQNGRRPCFDVSKVRHQVGPCAPHSLTLAVCNAEWTHMHDTLKALYHALALSRAGQVNRRRSLLTCRAGRKRIPPGCGLLLVRA